MERQEGATYYPSIRHKRKGDQYIMAAQGIAPKDAAKQYAADHPSFTGTLIVQQRRVSQPGPGIKRNLAGEYEFIVTGGQAQHQPQERG